MKRGALTMGLMAEIQQAIAAAKPIAALSEYATRIEETLNKLGEVAMHLGAMAMSPQVLNAFAFAHPVLEVCGDVTMAWMLLWRATVAARALEKLGCRIDDAAERRALSEKNKNAAFYEGQLRSVEFFVKAILHVTHGKMAAIIAANGAAVDIPEASFGGK